MTRPSCDRVRIVGAGAFVALFACGPDPEPRPQWLVTITTDAPVPSLGDRVIVDVYGEEGAVCPGCTRILGAATSSQWPVSFGIEADIGATMIRARLFRGELAGEGGTPRGTALIDAIVTLAASPADVEEVTVMLGAACFGVPADPTQRTACDPETGAVAPARKAVASEPAIPGSWIPGQEVPCAAAPPPGMVCLPGGVFLLGDPDGPPPGDSAEVTVPERLVQIPPLYMDLQELTLGDFFRLQGEHPELTPPFRRASGLTFDCTYDPTDLRPSAPINCISKGQAAQLCEVQGKRLPTEAEWEYAASNGGQETAFPWGGEDPDCDRTVAARDSFEALCSGGPGGQYPRGPAEGGSLLDVSARGVFNLGGNVSEWVADSFQTYGAGCWSGGDLLVGPLCNEPTTLVTARGGNYRSPPSAGRSSRRGRVENVPSSTIGVRCVASAR